MTYVDGFLLVVPKDKTEAYKKMAQEGRDMWMQHGALGYYECIGDDLVPPEMGGVKARSFTDVAGASKDETVWFSFIIFKSKAHRDEVNAKVMAQMSEQEHSGESAPFEMTRMAYGGFQSQVEA